MTPGTQGSRRRRALAAAAIGLLLTACASGYHGNTLTGGFTQNQISPSMWWVGYAGNGYTSEETVQSYWLYRCAQITLENGYDGFEIVTPMSLSAAPTRRAQLLRVSTAASDIERYSRAMKPQLEGQIRLLKSPFTPQPGRVFDAANLQAFLGPYVTGAKCGGDNVCPHVHRYLYPPAP